MGKESWSDNVAQYSCVGACCIAMVVAAIFVFTETDWSVVISGSRMFCWIYLSCRNRLCWNIYPIGMRIQTLWTCWNPLPWHIVHVLHPMLNGDSITVVSWDDRIITYSFSLAVGLQSNRHGIKWNKSKIAERLGAIPAVVQGDLDDQKWTEYGRSARAPWVWTSSQLPSIPLRHLADQKLYW